MKKLFLFTLPLAFLASCGGSKTEDTPVTVPAYTIEQFYKTVSIRGGAFSPDDSKLLYSSNESGIYNLYEIEIASGKKTALTQSVTESLFAISYVPTTGEVLYSADQGGNEISHIYLRQANGLSADLTPDAEEKAEFAGWAADDQSFFYTSNKRDARFFDVYKMEVSEWKSSLIYENKEGYDIGAISRDGKYISLVRSITTSENELYLYEVGTRKRTTLSAEHSGSHWTPQDFSLDNKILYYTSNAGKEFEYLNAWDIATGKSSIVFETKWDVTFTSFSKKDKYRITAINEDGKNVLMVQNAADNSNVEFPSIPDGDIMAVSVSNNEKSMRLTVGSSKSPADLYVYNFETKELKKLTSNLNPEIKGEHLAAGTVVRYKSFDQLEIPSIYYKPLNASHTAKVPGIVFVHGGPGGQSRLGYSALIQYLVNHGYAVLAVNNRGSSGYGQSFFKMDDRNHGDKDLQDCIFGKKYLQTLDYIDGENIAIMGGSYGGYMTMAAMTFAPDEFKAGVDIFGVTNWLRTLKSVPPYWESFRKALYAEMGDPNTADSVRLYNISPLFHADKVKHPVMVLQGANDPRVLQVESDEIVAAIRKNNVPVEYVVFPDEGHGFVKKENEMKGYSAVLKFLDTHLKKK
jgi:dipeptidyl aminopeptidase/acylaminoacyl peptidase